MLRCLYKKTKKKVCICKKKMQSLQNIHFRSPFLYKEGSLCHPQLILCELYIMLQQLQLHQVTLDKCVDYVGGARGPAVAGLGGA